MKMADTIGDMIDKLIIANVKLWHIEDERREFCTRLDLYDTDNSIRDAEKAKEYLNLIALINKERNSLIDQINASLRVLIDKVANKDSSFSLTAEDLLGTGKNKFYKEEK